MGCRSDLSGSLSENLEPTALVAVFFEVFGSVRMSLSEKTLVSFLEGLRVFMPDYGEPGNPSEGQS